MRADLAGLVAPFLACLALQVALLFGVEDGAASGGALAAFGARVAHRHKARAPKAAAAAAAAVVVVRHRRRHGEGGANEALGEGGPRCGTEAHAARRRARQRALRCFRTRTLQTLNKKMMAALGALPYAASLTN